MSAHPVLRVTGLTKQYDGFNAVDDVSFGIAPGEIIGLLGPNGAGKSTTINMILGILSPTAGKIEVLGKDLATDRSSVSNKMNFCAVSTHLPANMTVTQNLRVFGMLYGVKNLKEKINSLLKEFDLEKFANVKSGLLSSGESSRLNLAKALMNEPSLLLLDEPTASLDPSVAQLIRQEIKKYAVKNKAAILWTSHNMSEIEEVCHTVLFLSHGKVLLSGDPKVLPGRHGKKNLEDLFIAVAREPLTLKNNL